MDMAAKPQNSVNIGLTEQQREAICDILNTLLADEYVLYTKTRNYHWNVVGAKFNDLHKFFQTQYEALDAFVDGVAERSRSLGAIALGSMQAFLQRARLKEDAGAPPSAMTMVSNLLTDHETLIRSLRKDIATIDDKFDDVSTSDFLTGIMEQHEKMAWMLRAFVTPDR